MGEGQGEGEGMNMNKTKISPDDLAEFRNYAKDIKPLTQNSHTPVPRKKSTKKIKIKKEIEIDIKLSDSQYFPEITSDEIIEFSRPGLQHKILRQLKQGQFPIETVLDLHGMTSQQASAALIQFIDHCQKQNFRSVKIIHGKGRRETLPILKNKINQWLRQLPMILAFHSAKPNDGGAGAVYILLKKLSY